MAISNLTYNPAIYNKKSILKATLRADGGCYILRDEQGQTIVSLPNAGGRITHSDELTACQEAYNLLTGGAK